MGKGLAHLDADCAELVVIKVCKRGQAGSGVASGGREGRHQDEDAGRE